MDISKVRKAPYNPRTMSRDTKKSLYVSMEEFEDISGIVINERNGNVLAGNHRFDHLCKKHGQDNLDFCLVKGEFHAINVKDSGEFTGWIARLVDWDEAKEKMANVTANNELLSGEYTASLQEVLSSIKLRVPEIKIKELRLAPLIINDKLDSLDEFIDDDDDDFENIREKSEEANNMLDEPKEGTPNKVVELVTTMKITFPSKYKDEVKFEVIEKLSRKDYYKDITFS